MKGAPRFLLGVLLGVALGYAFVLLTHRAAPNKPSVLVNTSRTSRRRDEKPEPAEEAASF